jgi:CheY-like chemotaxis protein
MLPTVVLCDDEAAIRKLYRRALRSAGVDVVDAADGEACLELVATRRPVLVVLDLTLPGRSGFEVLAELATNAPTTRVVVVSGMVTPPIVEQALALGAADCVEKVRFVPQLRAMVGALVL